MLLLLLLLVCMGTSLPGSQAQTQDLPPGRCDELQTTTHHTPCTSCAASATVLCPRGFAKTTTGIGTGNCSYVVTIGGKERSLDGCSHTCQKNILQPQCCPDYWGPLCLGCPKWLGKTCNYHGTCMDGDLGNGTCFCEKGFTGFACQTCENPKAYGPDCSKECDCVNGICNSGPDGDGECYCQPPFTGTRCDEVSTGCKSCTAYTYCKNSEEGPVCECLPGYRRTPRNTCGAVCTVRDCHVKADCSLTGKTVKCVCRKDYEGDGKICVPKNPCADNNGGCPFNSTVCVFEGPNKSRCSCMAGMEPVGSDASTGCKLVSACSPDSCDHTAVCTTGLDGKARCECAVGQVGDGRRCYGNLMERLVELDRSGPQKGKLSGTITQFERSCQLDLTQLGPYTAFMPLLKTPLTGVDEELLCKNHLVIGQHLYRDLEGRDFNMYSGAKARSKVNKQFILMDDPGKLYTVVEEDLPASNGIIHIIDQPIISSHRDSPRDEKHADKTIGEILTQDEKYNRFLSMVDNCGTQLPLKGPGPLTVFVPTNGGVDRARDGSILYMFNDAKHKLQELIRHHMFSQAALTVNEIASMTQIQTMANQIIKITLGDEGTILLGEKKAPLESTNIIASNGIIHMVDGLLIPPSIVPILPHRCDITKSKILIGPCERCEYLFKTTCPDETEELDRYMFGCEYSPTPLYPVANKGCAKYCNATKLIPECCKGFYGPDCKPCIGGFQNPCYDKGTCFDGILGNGSCNCHPGFEGMACHICSDPNKFGDKCDEECHCLHGVCDNRPGSGGVCMRGSCTEGYSGDRCDKVATPCNSDGLLEHCHIHAYCAFAGLHTTCVCKFGYEGDGHSCTAINPCLKSDRGGCDTNAQCLYNAPGNASCVCNDGWSGDGKVCVEINNCQLETRGGCSPKADCKYIGPAQSECTCKRGYMGDGITCDPINPCLTDNGGCSPVAQCTMISDGQRNCTCPDGFSGDGIICYGNLLEELEVNSKLYGFFHLIQMDKSRPELDLSPNLTVLVPSREATKNLTSAQEVYWTGRHRLPQLLRAHILPGFYTIEDLDKLVGSTLQTLNPLAQWQVTNTSGELRIGGASIITSNKPAINGIIHIINKVLMPLHLKEQPPSLWQFLNSTPSFSLFNEYAKLYNLSRMLNTFDYTILMPNDDAIKEHLKKTNSTQLDPDVFKFHVIVHNLLYPDQLTDGVLKNTLLGSEYHVQFHINKDKLISVDDVPLNGSYIETQEGIVLPVNQVLTINRNRCSQEFITRLKGRCSDCTGPPKCSYSYEPIQKDFPPDMKPNCKYRKRVGTRRMSVPGCYIMCLRTNKDHSCCPGYYGHECYKCPGGPGNWCSNNGECQDGIQGNGECRCYRNFHGTACEDCEAGKYGVNCSSECDCVHGKCLEGVKGSGKCLCYKGWKGPSCSSEIKNDACGGTCHDFANCIDIAGQRDPVCVCIPGYEGNGTYCKAVDVCGRANGGCSKFADCIKLSDTDRSCSCKQGYTGDGVVCLEIDGCLVNNGGCDKVATCIRTAPNRTACSCPFGFLGSGKICTPHDVCQHNNGGCGKFARCTYQGAGQRQCSCFGGYVGDGFDCRGATRFELARLPEAAFFATLMGSNNLPLFGSGPFTTFVPLKDNTSFSIDTWTALGRNTDLVNYHIVSCEVLTLADLKTTSSATAVSGHTLQFSYREGSVFINNMSKIVTSDWTTADGVIHYIDKVLTPYQIEGKTAISGSMNFTTAAKVYGYSKFFKMVQDAGLLPILKMDIHKPFTMFWPTDKALSALPAERQHWLDSLDNRDKLASIVKAHIIRNGRLAISRSPSTTKYRTMHGSTITIACDKNQAGGLLLNGNDAQVVERSLVFDGNIAYGIDQLLEPPGLGAYCHRLENRTISGRCGNCYHPPVCAYKSIDTGRRVSCRKRPRIDFHDLDFHFRDRRSLGMYGWGCNRVCQAETWIAQCCKNHYGRDCEACAGGLESPCGDHGSCQDGIMGTGRCKCQRGFKGDACEICVPGFYGPNCTACVCDGNGVCEDGIEGSGKCVCTTGWYGDKCDQKIGEPPKECANCHADAECVLGLGCQCKDQYEGNGTFCVEMPSPDLCAEYNGGCHSYANCNQTGRIVNCTCKTGYKGDGFTCDPINRCLEEDNGGCSIFATCQFTGPNIRRCVCQPGYVGTGVQCMEKLVPPVDRCLEDNGGCDPNARCTDLHVQGRTAGVFHLRSPAGKYKMNFSEATAACSKENATLATFKQLGDAQQLRMHMCAAGWMAGGQVGYPIFYPSVRCGDNHVGVVMYKDPIDKSSLYDAYCYRMKEVVCVCESEYVGDGEFCNGDLASVVATNANFSVFYKMLLTYADSSEDGKTLMTFLSSKSSFATLFVPDNAGFSINETLSGRDLEYHISANHSRHLYEDLKHEGIIASRLGEDLQIAVKNDSQSEVSETIKLVNQRVLLAWDIPASNGFIHVIEGPLRAPALPTPHTPGSGLHSSGTVSAILVTLLLLCLLAGLGYYVFKHKNEAFRFQYFRNEDEDGASKPGAKPALVSIPNPLYSGYRAFAEPFAEPGQEAEPTASAEPVELVEPPKILDLE